MLLHPSFIFAEEILMVNRPVNASGLTGLIFTTSPYTLDPGIVELSASMLSESSRFPEYTLNEFPFSITLGLEKNAEVSIRSSYVHIKEGPTVTAPTERRTGDFEISFKRNIVAPEDLPNRPSIAIISTFLLPTENNIDGKIQAVSRWGIKAGLSLGTEIAWHDHVLGMYADAQLKGQDIGERRRQDIFLIANTGIILPISRYRNLQMFMEYSFTNGQDRLSVTGGDFSGFTYGLRLVSERFNFTMGTQFIHKHQSEFGSSDRINGLLSVKL